MTGLIDSRRNSSGERCAPVTAIAPTVAVAVAASFALFASGAIAQTPGTAGPVSLPGLFESESSTDLTPAGAQKVRDVAQRASAQGNCPKGTFTVVMKKGDDLFQQALAGARRDAILRILGDQARNFAMETDINGARDDVRVN